MKGKDFKPLQEEKDGGTRRGRGASRGRNFASDLWGEVRGGAEHFQSTKGQLPQGRIRQFFYGVALPFHIARVTLASPTVRSTYVRVTALQTAFLLAMAAGWAFYQFDDERQEKQVPAVSEAARQKAEARIEQRTQEFEAALKARQERGSVKGDTAAVKEAFAALVAEAVNAAKDNSLPPDEAISAAGDAAEAAGDAAEAAEQEAREKATAPSAEGEAADSPQDATADSDSDESQGDRLSAAIRAEVEKALKDNSEAQEEKLRVRMERQKKGFNIDAPKVRDGVFFLGSWEFWALFFGSLSAVQWIIVALSRDYHTVLSREASLATGVPPEDPEITPRVRLNVPWMRAKLQRRWRAFMLFVMGVPALILLCIPLCWVPRSFTVLSSLWGFWWLIVFTAAKSDRAWMAPVTRPPWFVRVWSALPVLHGLPLRSYVARMARRAEGVAAPIATVERQPWVFAGLAFTRFVGSIPPFRCFTRPFIPVASAHLIGLDPLQPPALKSGDAPPPHDAGD
ncbi:hypothetical protein [Corallococcus carmarthensis]|uniref:Uncharacterized protein n=1 Tax=Corallococcus carmarthensis TaxID=2316728 RepID=A0A3A8JR66_9BACT|nr:hypothetical protein [Corallococcus carmarthensis]RKG94300.1 hypothetical protein D7X32_42590 [Corallococcus carmarthensis]